MSALRGFKRVMARKRKVHYHQCVMCFHRGAGERLVECRELCTKEKGVFNALCDDCKAAFNRHGEE
jgi:hypothetical protein